MTITDAARRVEAILVVAMKECEGDPVVACACATSAVAHLAYAGNVGLESVAVALGRMHATLVAAVERRGKGAPS